MKIFFIFSTISGLQGAVASLLSFRTILICQDLLYDHDPVIEHYIFYMAFYFTYDIVVMYKGFIHVYKEQKQYDDRSVVSNIILFVRSETMMVIHHVVLQFIGLPILMVRFAWFLTSIIEKGKFDLSVSREKRAPS